MSVSKNVCLDLSRGNTFFWSVLRGSVDHQHRKGSVGSREGGGDMAEYEERNFSTTVNRYTRRKGKEVKETRVCNSGEEGRQDDGGWSG